MGRRRGKDALIVTVNTTASRLVFPLRRILKRGGAKAGLSNRCRPGVVTTLPRSPLIRRRRNLTLRGYIVYLACFTSASIVEGLKVALAYSPKLLILKQ